MSFRYALENYIKNPSFEKEARVYEDDKFVVIKDGFPKATIHYLILPKDLKISKQNPLTVFKDKELREDTSRIIFQVKEKILRRLLDEFNIEEDEDFIQVGVHSVPSMNNLHVHLVTRDFNSERLKHKQHYNSFTTKFFVNFEDLPLRDGDERLDADTMEKVKKTSDQICVYCGKNYKNKFAELKKHLTQEFNDKYKNKKRKIEVIEID